MSNKVKNLLFIDAIINIVLGILLLSYPLGISELLGVPIPNNNFYPTILGGVILGIGIALMMERYGFTQGIRGLGLGGAIVINMCGALTLLLWLIFYDLNIPLRGYILLWIIAFLVLGCGFMEIFLKSWKYSE